MKQLLILGFFIINVLGDNCEEHIKCQGYHRDCECEDGWGGDGCCDEQKVDPAGIVVGCLIFIIILLIWYFRKEIKRLCNSPIDDETGSEERQRHHPNTRNQHRIYPEVELI